MNFNVVLEYRIFALPVGANGSIFDPSTKFCIAQKSIELPFPPGIGLELGNSRHPIERVMWVADNSEAPYFKCSLKDIFPSYNTDGECLFSYDDRKEFAVESGWTLAEYGLESNGK